MSRLALHRAIQRYDVNEVRKLLRLRGPSKVNIEAKNGGETPLLHAFRLYVVLASHSESVDPNREPDDFIQEIEETNTQNEVNQIIRRWQAERMSFIRDMRKVLKIIVMLIGAGADATLVQDMMRNRHRSFAIWNQMLGSSSNTNSRGIKYFSINDEGFVRRELKNAINLAMKIRNQQRRSARLALNQHLPNEMVQMILQKAKLTNYGPKNRGMISEMESNRQVRGQSTPRGKKRKRSVRGINANPRPHKKRHAM